MEDGCWSSVIPSCQQQSGLLQQDCDHTAGRATPAQALQPSRGVTANAVQETWNLCAGQRHYSFSFQFQGEKRKIHWWTCYFAKGYLGSFFGFHFKETHSCSALADLCFLLRQTTNKFSCDCTFIIFFSVPPSNLNSLLTLVFAELHEHFPPSSWCLFRGNLHFQVL